MGEGTKTMCASWAAALFRILITPIDAFKTTLQVQGTAGLSVLQSRIASDGILTLWSGALATSFDGRLIAQLRRANDRLGEHHAPLSLRHTHQNWQRWPLFARRGDHNLSNFRNFTANSFHCTSIAIGTD